MTFPKAVRSFLISAIVLALSSIAFAQSNRNIMLDPSACGMTATTTAFTQGPLLTRAAADNVVMQATTNTTGGTTTVTCQIPTALRFGNAAGKIQSINLFYAIQTTAMASIAAPVISRTTYANSTAPGAAAAGTVVATAGGTLTVTPTVLQLTTTAAGACFNEKITFGTPASVLQNSSLSVEQVFTNSAAATVLQICGVQVNFTE